MRERKLDNGFTKKKSKLSDTINREWDRANIRTRVRAYKNPECKKKVFITSSKIDEEKEEKILARHKFNFPTLLFCIIIKKK